MKTQAIDETRMHEFGEKQVDDVGSMMLGNLAHDGTGLGTCMGEAKPRQMCANAGFAHFRKLDFDHPLAVLYEVKI